MEINSTNYPSHSLGVARRTEELSELHQATAQQRLEREDTQLTEATASEPFIKVYTGNTRSGAVNDPEKSERIDAVLSRLSESEQAALIDNNPLLLDDKFLQLAQELSDDELSQFVAISSALQTSPSVGGSYNGRAYSGAREVASFIDNLQAMDSETRSRVLDKAEGFAAKVVKNSANKDTYGVEDIWHRYETASTANDLFNFNAAISGTDDVNKMLDKIEQFAEPQQGQLLALLRRDNELGEQVIEQLEGRDIAAQDAILGYLTELDSAWKQHLEYNTSDEGGAVLDFDNSSHEVLVGMIEDTVALLENYHFDDEQLQQMGNQLQHMERSDQRAYLAITKSGLETLLGDPEKTTEQVDLSDHKEVFEQVDQLRNNAQTRELVFESRMGEHFYRDDQRFYAMKSLSEANRDMSETVRVLATDAWLNDNLDGNTTQAARLPGRLSAIGADQRDQLVQELNQVMGQAPAVASLSKSELKEHYGDFFGRTTAMAKAEDFNALIEMADEVKEPQRDSFWQAIEVAGESANDLLKVLDENSPQIRELVITELAAQVPQIEAGKKTQMQADQDLEQLVSYLAEDHSDEDKLKYLAEAF